MKIRLMCYRGTTLYLCIEKQYVFKHPIISLGCDCHPAYVLKTLNLRKHSFPFDWMNTTPSRGIDYVNMNIRTGFESFLIDMIHNERGRVVSKCFEDAEFYHYPELIDNQEMKNKLFRRAKRFLNVFHNRRCMFLFNVTSEGLGDRNKASLFVDSVNEFSRLVNERHVLLVYIRFEESLQENRSNCDYVETMLLNISNTRITKYIRNTSIHGHWGDQRQYTKLLESLGVKLRLGIPRMYFLKEYKQCT